MNGNDFIPLLGLPYDDPTVRAFLRACEIDKEPKLKRDESTAIVKNPKLGLEITFRDEQEIAKPSRRYEEGALVLSNVRMYGEGSPPFRRFKGELPQGIQFDFGLKAVQAKLGGPGKQNKFFPIVHWDFKTHYLVARFDKQYQRVIEVSLQLPGVF